MLLYSIFRVESKLEGEVENEIALQKSSISRLIHELGHALASNKIDWVYSKIHNIADTVLSVLLKRENLSCWLLSLFWLIWTLAMMLTLLSRPVGLVNGSLAVIVILLSSIHILKRKFFVKGLTGNAYFIREWATDSLAKKLLKKYGKEFEEIVTVSKI